MTMSPMSASMPMSAMPPPPPRHSRSAAHVVRLDTWVQRVTGVPLDARAALGAYDEDTGRYTLYAGSGGVVRQKRELAAVLRRAGDRSAGGLGRRRRQLRHPQRLLSGIRAGRVGGKTHRPAGQMDLREERGVRQRLPGPRPVDPGGARARCRRALSGAARIGDLQCRRAQRDVRAAGQMHRIAHLGVSRPGGGRPCPRGAQHHAADHSLSQRRPARGDVRDRAADRSRRPPIRL